MSLCCAGMLCRPFQDPFNALNACSSLLFHCSQGWQIKWITFCGKKSSTFLHPLHLRQKSSKLRCSKWVCRNPPFISKLGSRSALPWFSPPTGYSLLTSPWTEFTQLQKSIWPPLIFFLHLFSMILLGVQVWNWSERKWTNSIAQIHGLSFGMTDCELGATGGFQPWAGSSSFQYIGLGIKISTA